jgi:diguanylate cyclase (GGDEF)-like protein/PAS domain S-box-containing protein
MQIMDVGINFFEKNINMALELINFGNFYYDVLEDKTFWSDTMFNIFDVDYEVVPAYNKVLEIIHPEDCEYFHNKYQNALIKKKGFSAEYRIIRRDGEIRVINQYVDLIINDQNQVVKLLGTSVDVTEQRKIHQELKENKKKIRDISNMLEVGIWSKDKKTGQYIFCSKGFETICGYSPYEFEQNLVQWKDIVYKEDVEKFLSRNEKLKDGKVQNFQYRIVHKNGAIKWVQDETIPTFDSNGELIELDGIITDISEQKVNEEQMTYLAYHDYLTGLPNRRMFKNELSALIEKSVLLGTEFALMYLDIDGFKRINDTFGHLIGDKLLSKISSKLKKCIDEQDLICRMGGDEFSVLLRNLKERDPVTIAQKIITALEEPFLIDGYELYITTSIGIAPFQKLDNTKTVYKKADMALYRAKTTGKNNYQICTSLMEDKFLKLYTIERDIRKALKNNDFQLYYQPKVEAHTGKIIGAEALLRWCHHECGMISPDEFIPIAEENGLIFRITDWTLRTVCEQIRQWELLNFPLVPISVNISPKRFFKNDWGKEFIKIITETKVNPNLLELEITESTLIQNEKVFLSSINDLKDIGVKVSLDDFGTGYSSLFYLDKYNLDTVKIDQCFINSYILENKSPLTKYIINLAHELNMNVVAEGVETEKQLTILREQGCDQIQGYLFSKPVPVEYFTELLVQSILTPTSV